MPPSLVRPATAAAITIGLFVVFNANLRSINSIDTAVTQHTALALAQTGRADLSLFPALAGNGIADGYVRVIDGRPYSSYPLLPALLAAPAYRGAVALGFINVDTLEPWRIEAVGALVASFLVALACGVVYLTVSAHGATGAASVLVAVACGLATPLWSSASQALWSHAPAVLFLALGLSVLTSSTGAAHRPRLLLMAGAALTLAVFCRQLLIVFPACAFLGLWHSGAARPQLWMFAAGSALAAAAMVAVNLLFVASSMGGFVELYTGGVTTSTHAVSSAWSSHWLSGLAGVLVSPSRGLLLYMPVVLVAVAGAMLAWRDHLARYVLVAPTALYLAVWSQYAVWWGGHSFGPRIASDLAVPFALLAAMRLAHWPSSTWTKTAATAALVWSILIQGLGVRSYPAGDWNGLPLNVDLTHDRLWDWRDNQISRTISSGTYRQYQASLELEKERDADDGSPTITDLNH